MKKLILSLLVFLWIFTTDLATTENVPPVDMNAEKKAQVFFGNGIGLTLEEAKNCALRITDLLTGTECQIVLFYQPTRGFWKDFQDIKNDLKTGNISECSKIIAKQINDTCAQCSGQLVLIFHSEGAINFKNALPLILKENRNRLEVFLLAATAYISHEFGCKVTHIVHREDPYIVDIFTNLPGNEQLKESAKNPSVKYVDWSSYGNRSI